MKPNILYRFISIILVILVCGFLTLVTKIAVRDTYAGNGFSKAKNSIPSAIKKQSSGILVIDTDVPAFDDDDFHETKMLLGCGATALIVFVALGFAVLLKIDFLSDYLFYILPRHINRNILYSNFRI